MVPVIILGSVKMTPIAGTVLGLSIKKSDKDFLYSSILYAVRGNKVTTLTLGMVNKVCQKFLKVKMILMEVILLI